MPSSGQERRVAANESLVRDVNERIGEGARRLADEGPIEFLCECADYTCSESTPLTLEEYERVRAHPDWFVLIPGHEAASVERIVETNDRYLIVEKLGAGADVARERDPRA
jgi:hypothetical protein